jgi:hypothetical protein
MLGHLTPRPTRDMRLLVQCPAHIKNPFGQRESHAPLRQRESLVDVERGVNVERGGFNVGGSTWGVQRGVSMYNVASMFSVVSIYTLKEKATAGGTGGMPCQGLF